MSVDATIFPLPVAPAVASCESQPAEPSECPPPLMWADVLARVEDDVRESRCERAGGVVTVHSFGTGRPLYVLPGALGDWKLLSLWMWLLREDFRTVVVDPPVAAGRRLSTRRFSAGELAADLLAAADESGDATFSLFATSLGTLPALQALFDNPSRIDRAVLHAADRRLRLSATERLLTSLGRLSRRPLSRVPWFGGIQLLNHRRWFPPFDASRWEFFLENIGLTPTSGLCRRLAGLKAADFAPRLGEIATPMLLLRCEGEGKAGAERTERMQAALPAAESRLLPHCGRFPFLTHPHVLAKAVKEFFHDRA